MVPPYWRVHLWGIPLRLVPQINIAGFEFGLRFREGNLNLVFQPVSTGNSATTLEKASWTNVLCVRRGRSDPRKWPSCQSSEDGLCRPAYLCRIQSYGTHRCQSRKKVLNSSLGRPTSIYIAGLLADGRTKSSSPNSELEALQMTQPTAPYSGVRLGRTSYLSARYSQQLISIIVGEQSDPVG